MLGEILTVDNIVIVNKNFAFHNSSLDRFNLYT